MALGTATYTVTDSKVGNQPSAPTFVSLVSFAGDTSYPTGGTAAFQAYFRGLTKDGKEVISVYNSDPGTHKLSYDKANDKLKVYLAAGTEVTAATNLSAVTFNAVVISQ